MRLNGKVIKITTCGIDHGFMVLSEEWKAVMGEVCPCGYPVVDSEEEAEGDNEGTE